MIASLLRIIMASVFGLFAVVSFFIGDWWLAALLLVVGFLIVRDIA